ncbi:MAG: alpha/beta hydrolase, partial [Sphingobacteriales bacterium]
MIKMFPVSFFLLFTVGVAASDTIYFKKALAVNAPVRYGREALYMDELAYQIYTGSLKSPAEGAAFGKDEKGAAITWKPIIADSLNRLRGGFGGFGGRSRGASYLYLTYNSTKNQTALINIRGNSGFFLNGEPHMGDAYSSGWLYIPVTLKKGLNEFYVRGGFITASLIFPSRPVMLNAEDPTVPFIRLKDTATRKEAAIVVINTTGKTLHGYQLRAGIGANKTTSTVPDIPAMSSRKVAFAFSTDGVTAKGKYSCAVDLVLNNKVMDNASVEIEATEPGEQYSETFTSHIDGSLQYYAVTPQINPAAGGNALFLSVHGAGVEAIGQARAYKPKDWGTLVAATNRRPRGFNWEDWGRLDALEVLDIAKQKFRPNPKHIYLTGHSMGGHGTWFLGATYPDKWAAIAPCAGYPTLKGYGSADGLIPDSSENPVEKILLRSSNQSDVVKLASNYKPLGVYVFHGDADRTVSVNYARQMRDTLGRFHADFSYYEYPGGSHWFGDHSVDWKPIFDFFKWHELPVDTAVNTIDFTTASPGISSSMNWAAIHQQQQPLHYSRIQLNRNRNTGTITGVTSNVEVLKLNLADMKAGSKVTIRLDSLTAISHDVKAGGDSVILKKSGDSWTVITQPSAARKGPHRYGTLKDAFNHNMVFVYGTSGNAAENIWSFNKARFDAETWYYRGNGAVDVISDKDYSLEKYKDRGVIIFGNANTNAAYNLLMA